MDDNDTEDLRDEALRRALLHAPDHAVVPNWRLRKAILDHAREAAMPFAPAEAPEPMRPWWQKLLGIRSTKEGGGRVPWNAALATLLIGVLTAVLWQREPVPGARPDGEALVHAPAQRSEAPAAPASAAPAAPATAVPAPALPPQAPERALLSSQDIPGGGPAPAPQAPTEPGPVSAPEQDARPPRLAERAAGAAAPSELARRQADGAALSASAGAAAMESRKKEAAASAGQAVPPPAPTAPIAPIAPTAPPALPALPALPTFSALSQWSRISITQRGGASRSLPRSEAQDLSALLGSAAISAVGPQPLAGAPEWRVALERSNGDVLATFELGRSQVRWREGRGAATTGTPSPAAVAALRKALQHAVEQPAQPASPPQLELKPAPQHPAASEAAPSAAPTR
ncbi:hypothetical protein [Variovorax sp. PBL-H6]|uniref:hypothetical protein n=1 Tax=Variovorax sp. PBL-H6 TaxID=434009 RepID=UPI0013A554AB|nr:hypothetical protein [Variovorax sp. PBL-H6]